MEAVSDLLKANATAFGPWISVKKVTDESRPTNAVIANDGALLFVMAANTKYAFRLSVLFDTNATANFKWRHIGPASPTLVRIFRNWLVPGAVALAGISVDQAFSAADLAITGTGTNGGMIQANGTIQNGANAGNFAFAWAQNTSNAGAAIVRAGSYLEWAQF